MFKRTNKSPFYWLATPGNRIGSGRAAFIKLQGFCFAKKKKKVREGGQENKPFIQSGEKNRFKKEKSQTPQQFQSANLFHPSSTDWMSKTSRQEEKTKAEFDPSVNQKAGVLQKQTRSDVGKFRKLT